MNLASHRNRTNPRIAAYEAAFAQENRDRKHAVKEIAQLVDRFNQAHTRLNEIELALHEKLDSRERPDLLRSLEDARTEYMDARFALSVGNAQ